MTATLPLTVPTKIRQRNVIKLPEAFTMMNGLEKGSMVNLTFGQNFQCLIILPADAKLHHRMEERISILTTSPLDSSV